MLTESRAGTAKEAKPLRVAAIGGGTGLATLLKGLKRYVIDPLDPAPGNGMAISRLSAIVTVTDDGGSSGRLRKELNMLPPGDVRNCIVALSEDEQLLSTLFQHRFRSESALNGHTLGNLFVAALTSITGDFAEAVRLASEILATRGHIYPATTANVELEAVLADGSRVRGETAISQSRQKIVRLELSPANARPLAQAVEALKEADLITIGPGSLYTSLIPNLLVGGLVEAIAASSAIKVLVCNLMTQANESLGMTAAEHIQAIYHHAGRPIFDFVLINDAPPSPALLDRYSAEGAAPLVVDEERIRALGVEVIRGTYLGECNGIARHAAGAVARDLLQLRREAALAAEVSIAA